MCTVKGGNCTYVLSFSQSFFPPLFPYFPLFLLPSPPPTADLSAAHICISLHTWDINFHVKFGPDKSLSCAQFLCHLQFLPSLSPILFLMLFSYLLSGLHSICRAIKFWNSPLRDAWRIRNFNYFNNLFAMHKQIKPFANIYKLSCKCKTYAQARHTQWYALKYAMQNCKHLRLD